MSWTACYLLHLGAHLRFPRMFRSSWTPDYIVSFERKVPFHFKWRFQVPINPGQQLPSVTINDLSLILWRNSMFSKLLNTQPLAASRYLLWGSRTFVAKTVTLYDESLLPEGLLLCSQGPATGPYPEPDESNAHPLNLFPLRQRFSNCGVRLPPGGGAVVTIGPWGGELIVWGAYLFWMKYGRKGKYMFW
jgi:hypothetical protein